MLICSQPSAGAKPFSSHMLLFAGRSQDAPFLTQFADLLVDRHQLVLKNSQSVENNVLGTQNSRRLDRKYEPLRLLFDSNQFRYTERFSFIEALLTIRASRRVLNDDLSRLLTVGVHFGWTRANKFSFFFVPKVFPFPPDRA